jgi:hypothetical protein
MNEQIKLGESIESLSATTGLSAKSILNLCDIKATENNSDNTKDHFTFVNALLEDRNALLEIASSMRALLSLRKMSEDEYMEVENLDFSQVSK